MSKENSTSIHSAFEAVARSYPDHAALILKGEKLDYRQLNHRANYLARHLQSIGVQRGDNVALAMARSFEMVIAMLAILKCGAAYLPLDDSNPITRNIICLESASVKIIVADLAGKDIYSNQYFIVSTDDLMLFSSDLESFDSVKTSENDKAYLMYTSGSTGNPKGVVVPHRAVVRLVIDTNYIAINESDTILQFAPSSFDASTFEFWGALLNGAKLVLYSGVYLDPNLLKKEISENAVSVMWLTAALFHMVTEKFIEVLSPLRVLLAGGDVLNVKYVNKVLDYVENITVINGYGPTENTTFTCCHVMTQDNRPEKEVLIGKAINGTNIHILDEDFQVVTEGDSGELFVSGRGVALGYMNDNDQSDAFFTNEEITSGLIYRTGDLVRENEQGEIQFLGRKDTQIKLRGYRVSLDEIRTNIVKQEKVRDAAIVRRSFDTGDQILVAYIQTEEGQDLNVKELRRSLISVLPTYMIPDKFILDEELPINSNGKIDRKLLQKTINEH